MAHSSDRYLKALSHDSIEHSQTNNLQYRQNPCNLSVIPVQSMDNYTHCEDLLSKDSKITIKTELEGDLPVNPTYYIDVHNDFKSDNFESSIEDVLEEIPIHFTHDSSHDSSLSAWSTEKKLKYTKHLKFDKTFPNHNRVELNELKMKYESNSKPEQSDLPVDDNKKRFSCTICDRKFRVISYLTDHLRVHTGERPFSCNQCGKSFAQKCGLNRHLTTHSENKPYECGVCCKRFKRVDNMKKHYNRHSFEKVYICDTCSKVFNCKTHLLKHLQIHNVKKNFPCKKCIH